MVENIPTQNATLCLDQQIPTTKCAPQKKHVQHDNGCEALTAVKTHQFVLLVGER